MLARKNLGAPHELRPSSRGMRVLFTSTPGYGHVQPMLPMARAFEAAGHSVAIAVHADLCARVEAAGLTALHAGTSFTEWFAELNRRHPGQPWDALTPARILEWFLPRLFGEIGAEVMLADLLPIAESWRPDLLVYETFELAGPVCASVVGIPSVHHTLGPLPAPEALRLAAAAAAPLRQQHGLDSIATIADDAMTCVDICPPSLRTAPPTSNGHTLSVRPLPAPSAEYERLPRWVEEHADRPLIHATLGTTQMNHEQSLLASVIAGLRDEPVNLVVTVGPENDPDAFGEQPDNVHLERYIPHSLLLPHCALVIGHGGAGTMLGALGSGLPLLTIPQGADQYINADVCARRGVGRTLLTRDVTPQTVRAEVRRLMDDLAYVRSAREVQTEIAAMPAPQEVVTGLETTARG